MDHFDQKVRSHIDTLKTIPHKTIEANVANKRRGWVVRNLVKSNFPSKVLPRKAFECLFFDYMGLKPADLPVISEDDEHITWQSANPCPTLDACIALNIDTRKVCREVYEKSTQAFLSQIDPQLRFIRDYQMIRPYADFCLESIIKIDFQKIMEIILEEVKISLHEGDKAGAAVITLGNQIISKAHDSTKTDQDPSKHAPMKAIQEAIINSDKPDLSGMVLFSSSEPCSMCSSLAINANITTIVYGLSIQDTIRLGISDISCGTNDMLKHSDKLVEVIGGVLAVEFTSLLG